MKSLKESLINKGNIKKVRRKNKITPNFKKKDLKAGTVVKFREGYFGVYINDDLGEEVRKKFAFRDLQRDNYFLTYDDGTRRYMAYLRLVDLNDELYGCDFDDFDVIEIYSTLMDRNTILSFENETVEEIFYDFVLKYKDSIKRN